MCSTATHTSMQGWGSGQLVLQSLQGLVVFSDIQTASKSKRMQISKAHTCIQRGGLESPRPSHNFPYLESWNWVFSYLHVTERKYVPSKCSEILHQKQSEMYINSKLSGGGEGGGMPPDPPSRHACVSHTTIILLPSYPPPTQNPVWNPDMYIYRSRHRW